VTGLPSAKNLQPIKEQRMSDVTVTLAHFYDGKEPGDKYPTDAGTAKQLIRAGIAQRDDKAEAKAAKEAPNPQAPKA
jgi:hypothetical protein